MQMNLCGHGTLAAAHFLWTSGLVNGGLIEFDSMLGTLTAKKVIKSNDLVMSSFSPTKDDEKISVELEFPVIPIVGCDGAEAPLIPETLNGASITSVHKTSTAHDLIVSLFSFFGNGTNSKVCHSSYVIHLFTLTFQFILVICLFNGFGIFFANLRNCNFGC